ncbi:hypothetical protein [Hyphobacterium sp.]|uniref:hypothetical protein n=1 Tax=Hyphobacterium sp. TaxID=2004662 RepID=UPI00374A5379
MSHRDTLFDNLSPIEAQAFHQNRRLPVEKAVQFAMKLLEQGESHVDVAVLATTCYEDLDEFNRDFVSAKKALNVPPLSDSDAELIRLDCVLRWAHGSAEGLRDLSGELAEHGPTFFRMRDKAVAPNDLADILEGYWQLYLHSEDFFDLHLLSDRTSEKVAAAIKAANSDIQRMQALLRSKRPELFETPY